MDFSVTSVSESVGTFGLPYLPDLDSFDYYLALYNDGTVTGKEIFNSYKTNNLAIVLILKKQNDIIVPIFKSIDLAKDFAKRNMRHKLYGSTSLSKKFVNYCNKHGYSFRLLDFPKKIDLRLGYEFDCATLEHDEEVTIYAN